MSFTNQERINLNSKVLAASVVSANPNAQWYEERNGYFFILSDDQVLTQFNLVRDNPAGSLAQAQANAAGPLSGIIEDLSGAADAVRLTPVPGTNNSTYLAYQTYNDPSSDRLDKWIQPQKVPQASGAVSNGYSIRLYDGDPNAGGTEVTTSEGQTGSGSTASVGWIFNYDQGLLLLADDFKSNISDPYIVGFRYIGQTVANISGSGGDGYWEGNGNDIYNNNSGSVGIGTISPDGYALLDLFSNDQGVLLPRLTTAQRDAIGTPTDGLVLFNSDTNRINIFDGYQGFWVSSGQPITSDLPPPSPHPGELWVSLSDYENYLYDSGRNKWLSSRSITLEAGRKSTKASNIYLYGSDGVTTLKSKLVLPFNCTLISISAYANNAANWTAEVRISESLVPGASLSVSGKSFADTNVDFSAGDELEVYLNGNGVAFPKVLLFFARRGS